MKSMRTTVLRAAVVTAASLTIVMAAGTAAQAHDVSIFDGPGSGGIEANHTRVWVCKDVGRSPIWITVRFSGGSLKRYDGPADAGFCRNHNNIGGTPNAIRLCWGATPNTTCTAFKDA
jgi:hypothetical protein